jgi:hypothetical protein
MMRVPLPAAIVFASAVAVAACDDSTPTAPTSDGMFSNVANSTSGRHDLEGRFSFTFTAAPSCSQLPPAVRSRTFTGVMSPTATVFTAFTARLEGADFFPSFDTFSSTVSDGAARFRIFSWDAFNRRREDHPIVERVGPTSFVALQGTAHAPLVPSPTAILAQFDGSFTFCPSFSAPGRPSYPPTCAAPVQCRSDRHELRLIRK